jgi:hypothetical protein
VTRPLWEQAFAACGVKLGPGAERIYHGQPEVWVVWSVYRWDGAGSLTWRTIVSASAIRWQYLNGETIHSGARLRETRPAWSMAQQALYDGATAAALVLLLEDDPDRRIGALRLK